MNRLRTPDLISLLLIMMFSYAAVNKLIDFSAFKVQMSVQPVPKWSVVYLVYGIPLVELTTILTLLFDKTKSIGLFTSTILMIAFTTYVGLAMTGSFGIIPCSCGGIISHLSWQAHFVFNLIFLLLSVYATFLDFKERRFIGR